MTEYAEIALQIAAGVSLAACVGLRAFLPLLVTGVVVRMEWLPVREGFTWLGSWPALVVFGTAVVVELLADKVPIVDHALDLLQTFVKPVAGALLVAAVLTELSPLQAAVLGLLAGGAVAGGTHLLKSHVRVASTVLTGGLASPLLSLAEDVTSLAGSVVAIVVPVLALGTLLAALFLLVLVLRRRRAVSSRVPSTAAS